MTIKRSKGSIVFDACNIIFMLLFALMCLYPFYYIIIYSFSDPGKAYDIALLPKGLTFSNYKEVFKLPNIRTAFVVSVLRTLIGTSLTVGCCAFFGYLVSKERMVGRKIIYRLLVITMYVDGGLIPTFLIMNMYGFNDSVLIYIIPTALSAYNVILVKTYMEQLPAGLEESAMIDGAGVIRVWWSIVLPLSKPILATIAVFSAVGQWNAWFDAHIYIVDRTKWTLQYVLYRYLQQVQALANAMEESDLAEVGMTITPAAIRMTITAVVTLPILFVYPFMQRFFMKGLLLGAVKG